MVSQPGGAGVAQVLADHVAWATEAGWRVIVACDPSARLAELVRGRGGRVEPWRATRMPGASLWREVRALSAIVDRTDPDIVHLHSSKAGLVGRLVLRGRRPTLFQPHAWSFEAGAGVIGALSARWERLAARWTDRLICVSDAERRRGVRAGIRTPAVILPNVVDPERFSPGDRTAAQVALHRTAGVDAGHPLALCLGRLCRQKGQDLLLHAWPQITAAVPQASLALVGDGPDRERLASMASPGVILAGAVEDPVPWLRAADVVVLPSRWEGQALTMLEALACGVPVVASDIPANRETLPDGAGTVVRAADPEALSAAIVERLQPGRERATGTETRTGRAHVFAHHHPRASARRLLDLYDAVSPHGVDPPAAGR